MLIKSSFATHRVALLKEYVAGRQLRQHAMIDCRSFPGHYE
ncbi:hypothetical protein [Pseudomonas azotoformans]|nr:hypothetical protein [Pseudomonas azotoformans]